MLLSLVEISLADKVYVENVLADTENKAVIGAVSGVNAENVVMAFYIFPFLVLAVAEIGTHTGHGEVLPAAVEGGDSVVLAGDKPPVLVQDGLADELVMLEK